MVFHGVSWDFMVFHGDFMVISHVFFSCRWAFLGTLLAGGGCATWIDRAMGGPTMAGGVRHPKECSQPNIW